MILWGLHKGERLSIIQIVGFILAVIGFVVLVFPGLSAPPLAGSILMLGAGVAWGVYSLRGKGERNAASVTAGNFVRAVPFATALIVIFAPWTHADFAGIAYAVISGAVTSGLGYVVWYKALPGLKAASAATVQLSVPVLAATGGILLLGETNHGALSTRLCRCVRWNRARRSNSAFAAKLAQRITHDGSSRDIAMKKRAGSAPPAINRKGEEITMAKVVKVIELMSQSPKSWEDAAQGAVEEAAKTLRNVRSLTSRNSPQK